MDRINVVIVGAAQQFHPYYTRSQPQRDATPSFSATDSARSARSVDGCVVEERVAQLRYAHKEACVGVEARVKEAGCGRAERTREVGLERCVGVVVDEEPRAA